MTSKLLAVAQELASARERTGTGERRPNAAPEVVSRRGRLVAAAVAAAAAFVAAASPSSEPIVPPSRLLPSRAQGTIENAAEQLELYRGVVDNRVVARFDAALARHDLPAMAACARTMAEFRCGGDPPAL